MSKIWAVFNLKRFTGTNLLIVYNQNIMGYYHNLYTIFTYLYGYQFIIVSYYRTVCLYRYLSTILYYFRYIIPKKNKYEFLDKCQNGIYFLII